MGFKEVMSILEDILVEKETSYSYFPRIIHVFDGSLLDQFILESKEIIEKIIRLFDYNKKEHTHKYGLRLISRICMKGSKFRNILIQYQIMDQLDPLLSEKFLYYTDSLIICKAISNFILPQPPISSEYSFKFLPFCFNLFNRSEDKDVLKWFILFCSSLINLYRNQYFCLHSIVEINFRKFINLSCLDKTVIQHYLLIIFRSCKICNYCLKMHCDNRIIPFICRYYVNSQSINILKICLQLINRFVIYSNQEDLLQVIQLELFEMLEKSFRWTPNDLRINNICIKIYVKILNSPSINPLPLLQSLRSFFSFCIENINNLEDDQVKKLLSSLIFFLQENSKSDDIEKIKKFFKEIGFPESTNELKKRDQFGIYNLVNSFLAEINFIHEYDEFPEIDN